MLWCTWNPMFSARWEGILVLSSADSSFGWESKACINSLDSVLGNSGVEIPPWKSGIAVLLFMLSWPLDCCAVLVGRSGWQVALTDVRRTAGWEDIYSGVVKKHFFFLFEPPEQNL